MPHPYHPLLVALAGQASNLNNRPRRMFSVRGAVKGLVAAALVAVLVVRS